MKFIALLATAAVATTNAFWIEEPTDDSLVSVMTEESFKLDEVFKAMDANKDGALTMKEIIGAVEHYAKEQGLKLPKGWKKEVIKVFKHVDANGDKKITMNEIK